MLALDNPFVLDAIFYKGYKNQPWWLMIRLEMEKYNTVLIEKQQKLPYYHQGKLINKIISLAKKYYLLIKIEW